MRIVYEFRRYIEEVFTHPYSDLYFVMHCNRAFVGQINALNILSQNYMLILIAAAAILCGLVSVLVLFAAKRQEPRSPVLFWRWL